MLMMFERGKIFIAPDLKGKVSDYILDEQEDELEKLVLDLMEAGENALICTPDDFSDEYLGLLQNDQKILDKLVTDWENVQQDPKWDEFIRQLQGDFLDKNRNPEQKLVVFSESTVTVNYLKEKLTAFPQFKVLAISSSNRKELQPLIRANFDANLTDGTERSDAYNVIISTEVLAEGVNLHRANSIVNYDTPWNSTRLMQRIGRVNRIGSKAPKVFVYNFYPTAKVDKDIDLQKRAFMKIQAFHAALGEDSQIYSNLEEFETYGLFNPQDEEKNREIEFLMELREFRQNHRDEFRRIKNIPKRARTGRQNPDRSGATITFMKKGKRDAFFWINADNEAQTLNFIEAADIFKALAEEKGIALHPNHHDQIQHAIQQFEQEMLESKTRTKAVDTSKSAIEKTAIAFLKPIIPSTLVSEAERPALAWALKAIEVEGKFQNLARDIKKYKQELDKSDKSPSKLSYAQKIDGLVKIVNQYYKHSFAGEIPETDENPLPEKIEHNLRPDIIISESFT
jgi:superfamily II DNA/RNA helicase